MAFQIKDFTSVVAGMLNWMRSSTRKVTDFNQGSVVRTMLEASAAEVEEAYLQMFIGLKEAIPVSTYNTFGFAALEASAASGLVRFSAGAPAAADVLIPAGTQVMDSTGTKLYATQDAAVLPLGQTTIDVLVAAATPGVGGNVPAAAITLLAAPLPGIVSVTNLAPFVNGRDAESADDRKTRFQSYIASLARGTKTAVLYGARTAQLVDASGVITEYVAYAGLDEPWLTNAAQPVGLVNVYIHNGSGGTTADLVAEAQRVIDGYNDSSGKPVPGWKAAGVKIVVSAAVDQAVAVTGTVTVLPGFAEADVLTAAADRVRLYVSTRTIGEKVLLSELIAIVMRDVPGVFNVTLTLPAADVAIAANAKAVPGAVTLTAA